MTESQSNPPLVTTTLNVFVGCNTITWRWASVNFGSGEYTVQGIHIFVLTPQGQITRTYFEFDVVAGALDTGYTILDANGDPLQVIP